MRPTSRSIAKHSSAENLQALVSGYRHSLDDTTLFSKVASNKSRINVQNEITLICTKFGTNLINICELTSCKTNVLCATPYTVFDRTLQFLRATARIAKCVLAIVILSVRLSVRHDPVPNFKPR